MCKIYNESAEISSYQRFLKPGRNKLVHKHQLVANLYSNFWCKCFTWSPELFFMMILNSRILRSSDKRIWSSWNNTNNLQRKKLETSKNMLNRITIIWLKTLHFTLHFSARNLRFYKYSDFLMAYFENNKIISD